MLDLNDVALFARVRSLVRQWYVDKPDGRHLSIVQAPMTGVPVELTEATQWSGQITDVRRIG